jgi:excisionase family DNA binding protein
LAQASALERFIPSPNSSSRMRRRVRTSGGGSMKTWMRVTEAAEYAGVSRDTIYTACERREIKHTRVGGRRVIRLKPEWVDAWLERHALGARDKTTFGPTSLH